MGDSTRTIRVFQLGGLARECITSAYVPVSRDYFVSSYTGLVYSVKFKGVPSSVSVDYFLLPFEGRSSFLKIDSFSLSSFELKSLSYSNFFEFLLKEFKTRSGYVRRGRNIDSDYFEYNVERAIKIQSYANFLKLPTNVLVDKYSLGDINSSASSTCIISKWDEDPDSSKAIKKTATVTISQLDLEPFNVLDLSPASGSILIPKDSQVSFLLSDDLGGILLGELDIVIGDDAVITNGVDTATLGTISYEIETPPYNNIRYTYTKDSPFQEGETVLVHVQGKDLASPLANTTNFDYSFRIENTGQLYGIITADPDVEPPYIENTLPVSGGLFENPCSPITFDILDNHTGVNLDSLTITVDGQPIILEGVCQVDSSFVLFTPISNGYTFSYYTNECFEWGKEYTITVSGTDNYSISPNILDTIYSYETVNNDTILIDNFFIEEINDKIRVNNNTYLKADITDPIYGIDISATKLYYNYEEVVFSYVSITDGYRLSYQPPDLFVQSPNIVVTVHAVNSRGLSFSVFREKTYKLSPGYSIQVLKENKYEFDEEVIPIVSSDNLGRNPSGITEVFKFKTHKTFSKDLNGYIVSNLDSRYLIGTIQPVAPMYYYNKLINVRVEASDFEGNEMVPYEFNFRIQMKPE